MSSIESTTESSSSTSSQDSKYKSELSIKQKPEHLCIRPLTIYDLSQVLELEANGFPEPERCPKHKLEYRLTVCPELCSGLFVREFEQNAAQSDSPPPRSTILKETLIAHIIATKIADPTITERSMDIPKDETDTETGHVEKSRIIGIHSVIVNDKYRGLKLGSLLIKDYLQKLNQQFVADKVVLLAKASLTPFYRGLGFVDDGVSSCKFAGQEWHDLHVDLTHEDEDEEM
ncbi:hypothetical protein OGAPHI_002199 [Ogataea philodendri]|uniref:N-acetyltransferase domain-containing protein n=1 Tax=Ogataea philodendri TaxID=1378263 RepID=A0A9P8PB05_9ASCO|nr:uncharacterized protein OGAPHI_002199 [Ogataea philodendri]KAH3668445.1 hypothetical protein OGAPHI_002199 [Ogataea philodendri]